MNQYLNYSQSNLAKDGQKDKIIGVRTKANKNETHYIDRSFKIGESWERQKNSK